MKKLTFLQSLLFSTLKFSPYQAIFSTFVYTLRKSLGKYLVFITEKWQIILAIFSWFLIGMIFSNVSLSLKVISWAIQDVKKFTNEWNPKPDFRILNPETRSTRPGKTRSFDKLWGISYAEYVINRSLLNVESNFDNIGFYNCSFYNLTKSLIKVLPCLQKN